MAADVVLAWDPSTDGVTAGYMLSYGMTPQNPSRSIDVGPATAYTVSGLADGTTYYFTLQAYDALGALSDPVDVSYTTPTTAPPPITALSLTASLSSPQTVGATVNWQAAAAGGVQPYQFQWSLNQDGTWKTGAWGSAAVWGWTPTLPGSYQVRVAVRSAGNTSMNGEQTQDVPFTVLAPAASVTLRANLPSPQPVGTTITWSATGAGGVTPYQYQWWVFNGATWTAATGWVTSATWAWTPTAASDKYVVRVSLRSAGSQADAVDATASGSFPIKPSRGKGTCSNPKCR